MFYGDLCSLAPRAKWFCRARQDAAPWSYGEAGGATDLLHWPHAVSLIAAKPLARQDLPLRLCGSGQQNLGYSENRSYTFGWSKPDVLPGARRREESA